MTERQLLEWLGKAEYSQYGECYGKTLDALIAKGHVEVLQGEAVRLTPAGRAALAEKPYITVFEEDGVLKIVE